MMSLLLWSDDILELILQLKLPHSDQGNCMDFFVKNRERLRIAKGLIYGFEMKFHKVTNRIYSLHCPFLQVYDQCKGRTYKNIIRKQTGKDRGD